LREATRFNVEQFAPLLEWKVVSSWDVLIHIGKQLGLQLGNSYASIPFNSYKGYDLATKAIGAIILVQQIGIWCNSCCEQKNCDCNICLI